MKNILKILVLTALVAVMITALAVSTSAYISWDEETGTFPGGSNSAYADINAPGWEQVAGVKSVDRDSDGAYTSEGDLTKGNGTFNAYFNESTGTVVVESVSGNSITGNYGENDKAEYFANWAQLNADKVTAIEMRNVTHLNNPGYVFFRLTKAKTFKVESQLDEWSGTQPGTGIFYELASLETLYWGDWNKENGEYTITRGEEGVIDLRGFEYFTPKTTTYNGTHTLLFFDAAVFKTSARKVILPAKQELSNPNLSYNVIAVSEGYIDCNPGTEQNPNSNYNKEIAAGKLCTVLKNKTTGETGYTTFWAISPEWTAVSIKAAEDRFGGEYSGIIPYKFAYGASKLEEVEIPASVTLRYIEADAFGWCTSLKLIRVKGAVSADLYIENANAFAGISDLTIEVYSKQDKANMEAALKKVGITNVTVVSTAPVEPESATKSAITAGGYSIRIDDTKAKNKGPALRAEFTLLGEIVDVVERRECLDLEDFGVIVFSEKTLETIYEGNVNAVLAAGFANENPKIAKASAAKGPYISIDKNTGDRTFAVAITDISADKSTARIYTYAYAEWSDGSITYTTYTSERTGKTAHSLYDATVFAFRSGIVNSQNFNTGVDLWDILSNGAFTVKAGEEKAFADGLNLDVQYTLDAENDFTYLNLDLHSWVLYKNASGNVEWYSSGHSLEADNSSTNIVWSILRDGDELVVAYRRDPNAAEGTLATLPRVIDRTNYTASPPFSPMYFTPGALLSWNQNYKSVVDEPAMVNGNANTNGLYRKAKIYSPILSEANATKITTLVIDYGVTNFSEYSLENSTVPSLKTIVYPEGVSAQYGILANNSAVESVVYAPVGTHALPRETQGENFGNVIDLSGLKTMTLGEAFSGAEKVENVILPLNINSWSAESSTFYKCSKLTRVWSTNSDVPAAGTIDVSVAKNLKGFGDNAFMGVPTSTIIMPQSFQGVANGAMTLSNADNGARVFGADEAHTIVLGSNIEALTLDHVSGKMGGLISYRNKLHTIDATDTDYDNVDNIKVSCKFNNETFIMTIAEWEAYFEANSKEEYYKEDRLVIYSEFPDRIGRDYMYKVSVTQGDKTEAIPVYNHCQDYPAFVRDNIGGDNFRRFSLFAFSGEQVRIDVKVGCDFESYTVIPSAKEFKSEFKDGVISVYLDKPEYFVIRLDDDTNTILSVFADYPEYPLDVPSKDDPNVLWISGIQEAEGGNTVLTGKDQTIYLEPGSVFYSRIELKGENCKVLGRGALVDPYGNFYKTDPSDAVGVAHKFITLSGNGSCVDGPVLLDAHCYNFTSWGGGTVRNAKALSVFLTSDGFAMLNRDCTVEHCFVYVGDNALVFSGRNIVFNDVTVGTSCGALYPQNDVNSATLENIYVFRADEGVINNYWNDGSKSDRMVNVTINGLYADDCATLPYFFKGRNMGRAEKVFNMSDVTCRSTRGVVDYYTAPTNGFILFDTVEGELFTDNYTFNIKNLYIDGKLVSSADDLNIMQSGTDAANHINVTSDSTAVVTRKDYFIDYRSILNIFIGALQVYTDSPAIDDGVEIYLPVREIKALLRVSGTVDTTEKNGIAYVEVNDLVTAGLVEKVQKNGNALILTPVPKNGNLLLADSGDIPYFTEHRPYCVDMTARIEGGETIYTLANIIESDSGIRRALTSDVKMYGNGKYVLKFRIFGDGAARVKVSCQTAESSDVVVDKILSLDGTWTEVEIGFDISMDLSSIKNYSFSVASKDTSLEFFEIKNIALEKIG